MPLLGVIPCEYLHKLPRQKLVTVLLDTEDRIIVSPFVWTKHRNVTDRHDRWAEMFLLLQHYALQAMRTRCKNCVQLCIL